MECCLDTRWIPEKSNRGITNTCRYAARMCNARATNRKVSVGGCFIWAMNIYNISWPDLITFIDPYIIDPYIYIYI